LQTEVYKVKVVLISNDRFSGSKNNRRKVDESVESAFGVRKRIDKFGVTQPNIQK
jgi:hypothetical protein